MKNFDFRKVEKVMEYLGWTWRLSSETPTIAELKEQARAMLLLLKKGSSHVSSGGFVAERYKVDGKWIYSLSFQVEEWEE